MARPSSIRRLPQCRFQATDLNESLPDGKPVRARRLAWLGTASTTFAGRLLYAGLHRPPGERIERTATSQWEHLSRLTVANFLLDV